MLSILKARLRYPQLPAFIIFLRVLIGLGLGLISSCHGPGSLLSHRICLYTPSLPPSWEGLRLDGWRMVWRDAESVRREMVVSDTECAWVEIARGESQVILAYPQSGGVEFKPCGFLYPEDLGPPGPWPWVEESAVMSWVSGYSGEVALALLSLGFASEGFELAHLPEAARDRGADPWDLAPWKTARALAGGSYRASLYPAAKESLALPGGEAWRSESPFKDVELIGNDRIARLAEGLSLFHSDRKSLLVELSEEGARMMVWER